MFLQVLISNAKVIGVFVAISFISAIIVSPIWIFLESTGNSTVSNIIGILFSVLTTTLFFLAGRVFVKCTGVLLHDCLSFVAIILIFVCCFLFFSSAKMFFICPHVFLIIILGNNVLGQIFSVVISMLAVEIGAITKSGISSIY